MLTKTIGALIIVFSLAFCRTALAVDNAGTVGDCSNANVDTIEQCLMGDTLSGGSSGTTDVPCVKATSYDTCTKKCDCEWGKAKNKCNGGLACLDIASADHNACLGLCITDWAWLRMPGALPEAA